MNSKSKTSETQDEYNEEVRRKMVAEASGPVLDNILQEAKSQDIDNDTDGWPKIWSSISPTKLKFTRLKYPKGYKTDCDERSVIYL